MKKILVIMLLVVLAAGVSFAGGKQETKPAAGTTEAKPAAEKPAAAATDSKAGGVLIFGRSGDAVGLDPAREDDGESFYIADNVYETLVAFKPGTTEIIPALAESWTASVNGLEYTFKLRKGVKFHDGTTFTADAVVFSIGRQFKQESPYYNYGPWKYWGYMDMDNIIQDVVKVDDYTVKFILKKQEAPFIANLGMNFAAIVSPAAAEKYQEDFFNNPVGTGPFKFVSWAKDDNIVVERFNDYWGPKAYLDRVIFKVVPDATARYLALKKGEVDLIDFPSAEDLPAIEGDANMNVIHQEGLNVGYLAFNCLKKPFDNKLVRQAINYAINKQEIITGVYGKAGSVAKNPMPPTLWSYNNNIKDYEYNPEKAKQLLAQAGLKDGFSTTLWAMPVSRPYNPNARKIAEIMQAQLAKVGIKAEIVSYEWGTYLDKVDHGEHVMAMLGWTGDNGDPDNFLFALLSIPAAEIPAGNIAFWKNTAFNDLVVQAKENPDVKKRTELYMKAQEVFKEEAPWVTIAHSVVYAPMKKSVQDFLLSPLGKREFKYVWIKK
ncbi:MAG: ABC transporter substrate-binding protein [Spirochaetales bacterium]|nr:MAG: ABC transporter substrate-binding protein [Spirochaetales bacterium]